MALKFYSNVTKGLKLKVWKFLALIPIFGEVTRGKLVGSKQATFTWKKVISLENCTKVTK